MKIFNSPYMWSVFLVASLSANPTGVLAAPGPIADSPLFLSSGVQPNILFLVDDSGSMFFDDTLNAGTFLPAASLYGFTNVPRPAPAGGTNIHWLIRRLSCSGFNVMAYDPLTTYTPWAGVDSANAPYTDQTLASARRNPYTPTPSSGDNISNHIYFTWTDADADGEYDGPADGDYRLGNASAPSATTDECGDVSSNANGTLVSTLNATQQTNYANWYSYYRSRDQVAKKALSEIISNSTSRAGLGTMHNNNQVGTPITDIDDFSLPIDTAAQGNKITLMSQLFKIRPSGGTPLRQTLRNAGNYYQGSGTTGSLFNHIAKPDSPILDEIEGGACQQNFTILLSDGFANGGSPGVGNTDTDGAGPWGGGAYAGALSDTLADVAMKFYEEDLDTSLGSEVPSTPGIDTNTNQHMVTYTVAFGVNGTLTTNPAPGDTSFNWPTPIPNTSTTIDDMRHAAYNGRGQFLSAADPQQLITDLGAAISDIQSRAGTAAAVSFDSSSLEAGGALVFRSSFDSAGWHGDLSAFQLSSTGVLDPNPQWNAASLLDTRNLTLNSREIVTFNGTTGVSFNWPANYNKPEDNELSNTQIADLLAQAPFPVTTNMPAEITANTAFGQNILAFHRGDFTNEGSNTGQFRNRNGHRLGDIVHSSPVFVGQPSTSYPDALESVLYSTFRDADAQANRPARVYVGANDGMLHAFNAADITGGPTAGEEVFAYIPGLIYSTDSGKGLHSLAEQGYNHNYYVDLTPRVADVFIDTDGLNTGADASWKTILVGGLRAGGKGIFALDITNPTTNAADIPLWEFTHDDLGFTFSEIQIARLHNGKWAAIFGNGYNSGPAGDGRAKLFIRYLDGSGTVILDTQAGSKVNGSCSDAASDCNGLSTPALADLNGDAIIDRVYAGDLQGNLWVFDLTNNTPFDSASPNTNHWEFAYTDGNNDPIPLFQACTSTPCTITNRQPITSQPTLARHPNRSSLSTAPNILVYFGTGQYITSTDNTSAGVQTHYGVWDGGTFGITPRTSPLTRDNLVFQTISGPAFGPRTLTQKSVNYNPSAQLPSTPEYGWRIDLPTSKERVVVESTVIGRATFFNTLIPSTSICSGGGGGFSMFVDMLTGGQLTDPVIDVNKDDIYSNDRVAGVYYPNSSAPPRFIRSASGITSITGAEDPVEIRLFNKKTARRISWRHLDYQ